MECVMTILTRAEQLHTLEIDCYHVSDESDESLDFPMPDFSNRRFRKLCLDTFEQEGPVSLLLAAIFARL